MTPSGAASIRPSPRAGNGGGHTRSSSGYSDEGPQQPQDGEDPRQELPRRAPAWAGLRDQQEEPAHEGAPGLKPHRLSRRAGPAALAVAVLLSRAAAGASNPLDDLYAHLQAATSRAQAETVENQIVEQAGHTVSPTAGVLLDAAHAEQANDQPNKAIADLGAAIDLQPELGPLWRERGIARFRAGDLAGADADLGRAIDIDRRDFLAWSTLSLVLEHQGNLPGALAAWQRVLTIDPHAADAQHRLDTLTRKAQGEHA